MSTTKQADDYSYIRKRLEEIEAEKRAAIVGEPVEAPKDIDWGMFSVDAPD